MKKLLLEDCCEILDSMRIPITASERKRGSYPYYGANGIQDYVADYIFDDELVLLAEDGGNFGSKTKPIAYRVSGKCWVNNHAHVLKPKKDFNVDYLCYSLMFYNTDGLVNGATRQKLTQATMRQMLIPQRAYQEQCDIVAQMNKVNLIIKTRQNQLQNLDELVKARFVELFGEPKINPHNYPACQLSEHISFLTSGSRGWAQYCTDNGSEWFITIKNVKDCHVSTDNMQPIDAPDNAEAKRTKVQEGDLLISITADLGRTGVVTKEIAEHGAYINQHLTCIRLNKTVLNPLYVAYFMESPAGKEQFELKNQSAVKAGLNFNSIKSLRIMIPPISEQNVFVAFLNQVDKSKLSPYRDCWTRCNFCLAVWCDNTSNKEDIMEWLMNLDPSIWAALIGAVGAIIVALIKVIIPLFKKKEKASDKVAPSINQTVTGNGNTVIGIQNNMKGEKDGQ